MSKGLFQKALLWYTDFPWMCYDGAPFITLLFIIGLFEGIISKRKVIKQIFPTWSSLIWRSMRWPVSVWKMSSCGRYYLTYDGTVHLVLIQHWYRSIMRASNVSYCGSVAWSSRLIRVDNLRVVEHVRGLLFRVLFVELWNVKTNWVNVRHVFILWRACLVSHVYSNSCRTVPHWLLSLRLCNWDNSGILVLLLKEIDCLIGLSLVLACTVKASEVWKVICSLEFQIIQFVGSVPHILILRSNRIRIVLGTVKRIVLPNYLRHVKRLIDRLPLFRHLV